MKAFRLALLASVVLSLPVAAADVVGVVTRVDLDKKEVILDGRGPSRGKTVTLLLDGDTQVLFGKQPGTPLDLSAGRHVRIDSVTRDNVQVAQVIHVTGPKPKTPAVPAEKGAITGVLRRVALTDREVVVIGPGAMGKDTETTIAVPETARITKAGKPAKLEELKEEESISIVAEKRDGKLTATSVQVGASATSAKTDIVPKLRLAIRIADFFLQKMEKPAP